MPLAENGIFNSKPDKPGLPINGGNQHGKVTARPKLKSAKRPINQPKEK